jgi:hypothetical protein
VLAAEPVGGVFVARVAYLSAGRQIPDQHHRRRMRLCAFPFAPWMRHLVPLQSHTAHPCPLHRACIVFGGGLSTNVCLSRYAQAQRRHLVHLTRSSCPQCASLRSSTSRGTMSDRVPSWQTGHGECSRKALPASNCFGSECVSPSQADAVLYLCISLVLQGAVPTRRAPANSMHSRQTVNNLQIFGRGGRTTACHQDFAALSEKDPRRRSSSAGESLAQKEFKGYVHCRRMTAESVRGR